jgi:outer membrane protein OmpA-like peptidoglycan-associated protein
MMKWTALLIVGFSLAACQTTAYQEKFNRTDPIGVSVSEPFDVMVANGEQPNSHMGNIYFLYDDAVLSETNKQELQTMANNINHRSGVVILEGHASYENSEDYNQTLGYKRALAVAVYLLDAGVWEERMKIKSFGKSRPIANNHTENSRADNRRVEIKILAQGEGISGLEAEQLQLKLITPPEDEQAAAGPSPLEGLMDLLGGGEGM